MDGGTSWGTNIASAVHRCREVVDNDKDIIIDKIILSYEKPKDEEIASKKIPKNAWTNLQNYKSFRKHSHIPSWKSLFPDVEFRHSISPSEPLDDPSHIDFSPKVTTQMQEVGMKDGIAALTKEMEKSE